MKTEETKTNVSQIIPVYNDCEAFEKVIPASLVALLATNDKYEFTIAEDGSTQKT